MVPGAGRGVDRGVHRVCKGCALSVHRAVQGAAGCTELDQTAAGRPSLSDELRRPTAAKVIRYSHAAAQTRRHTSAERATKETADLTRAPLGYSAERAPLGGGGRFCPPA